MIKLLLAAFINILIWMLQNLMIILTKCSRRFLKNKNNFFLGDFIINLLNYSVHYGGRDEP